MWLRFIFLRGPAEDLTDTSTCLCLYKHCTGIHLATLLNTSCSAMKRETRTERVGAPESMPPLCLQQQQPEIPREGCVCRGVCGGVATSVSATINKRLNTEHIAQLFIQFLCNAFTLGGIMNWVRWKNPNSSPVPTQVQSHSEIKTGTLCFLLLRHFSFVLRNAQNLPPSLPKSFACLFRHRSEA